MPRRFVPYIVILVFSIVFALTRIFIFYKDWSWFTHVLVFCMQVVFLIAVWHLVKILNDLLEKRIPYEKGISKRILVQIAISLILILPFPLLFIWLVSLLVPSLVTTAFIAVVSMFISVLIVLLNIGYGAFYFFKQWRISVEEKAALEVRTAQAEKDKSMMQYHHLRNQVNPHFLFNTFTSLDGLIQTDPQLASEFVRHLSKVYRYILENRKTDMVSVRTESDFIQHYIRLLKMRYGQAIEISLDISDESSEKKIVMTTLQLLIDNAVKHNIAQSNMPLKIKIRDENGYISIENNKQLRKQIEASNGNGLLQLQQLYGFITDKKINITETDACFKINLPLL